MARDEFENTQPTGDHTQVFGEVVETSLQESLAKLGPRTTTHSVAPPEPDETPSFDVWVDRWIADHVPVAMDKARQYGSNSLAKKGYRFATAGGRGVTVAHALELGVAQYIAEKADRIEDSILRGMLPSEDTWVDVAIYALMAQYIRQHGRW
jgi:hypothetical protein